MGTGEARSAVASGSMLWGAILFAAFGLCMEIAFTGIAAGWGGSFRGGVSLLMIPVYATAFLLIGPLLTEAERLGIAGLPARVPFAVVVIYAIEWGFGAGYEALGLEPWRYRHGWASDFSHGHVTLLYLPAWIAFAVVVVPVWRWARSLGAHADAAARRAFARPW